MKKKVDPRHKKRIILIQRLFSTTFKDKNITNSKIHRPVKAGNISKNLKKIDKYIATSAPQFPIETMTRIDVAILRLAVFELLIEKSQPPKVIIDEAIEIAKEYGADSSPGFINGVLGNIYKQYND